MKLKWPPTGHLTGNGIADHERFTSLCGRYEIVRSQIIYGTEDRYPPSWYAIYLDPFRHIIARCSSQKKAVAACNFHDHNRRTENDLFATKPPPMKKRR